MNTQRQLEKYERLAEVAHRMGAYACARKWSIKAEKLEAVISALKAINNKESKIMRISVEIGHEWHTTNRAKGFVFVAVEGKEEHIYKSSIAKLIRKDSPNLIGNKGKHGSWTRYTFEIPEGTILKLYTDSNHGIACGYFKVSSEAPLVRAYGEICHGNGAEIEGQIEWVSPNEFDVDPKQIAWYDKGNLTIKELLPAQ